MTIQDLIRQHRNTWIVNGDFGMPDLADCLDFMVCEASEAVDARLRMSSRYIRNNPANGERHKIAIECFDTIMMACTALDILGFDLLDIAHEKLARMDAKRGIHTNEPVSEHNAD